MGTGMGNMNVTTGGVMPNESSAALHTSNIIRNNNTNMTTASNANVNSTNPLGVDPRVLLDRLRESVSVETWVQYCQLLQSFCDGQVSP